MIKMATRVIHFEDDGQDFLRWYVDDDGVVVDSQPFQASTWCGCKVVNLLDLIQGTDTEVQFESRYFEGWRPLIHRVEKLEPCEHADDNELPPCIGEAMRDTVHGIQHRAANRED